MLSFRWQQNTQEIPWDLRNQNLKQRTSRSEQIQQNLSQPLPMKSKVGQILDITYPTIEDPA